MKYLIKTILFLSLLASSTLVQAQLAGGFKAGLNFSQFDGPTEEAESFSRETGFHIGAIFKFPFTDRFGLKAELMYSQKGTKYNFDGDSYWVFYTNDDNSTQAFGNRAMNLTITNAYIDIPVMGYARFGNIEFTGGVNVGFLAGSTGRGGITFSGVNNSLDEFTTILDYSYFRDDFREDISVEQETRVFNGTFVTIPDRLSAYYEAIDNDEKAFNRLDFGIHAGIAFYLNKGLYVGGRLNYGLSDVTNNEQDVVKSELDADDNFILSEDKDQNMSLQVSIGFSF